VPEYNIDFSEKLIDSAKIVADNDLENIHAKRTVLYLSCLACEIVLKALLEKAGKNVSQIKARSHSLSMLLTDIGECEILDEVTKDSRSWVSAKRLRSVVVDKNYSNATIGSILTAETLGASKYPNEVRYGDKLKNYPPELWLKTAVALIEWAKSNWESIRLRKR